MDNKEQKAQPQENLSSFGKTAIEGQMDNKEEGLKEPLAGYTGQETTLSLKNLVKIREIDNKEQKDHKPSVNFKSQVVGGYQSNGEPKLAVMDNNKEEGESFPGINSTSGSPKYPLGVNKEEKMLWCDRQGDSKGKECKCVCHQTDYDLPRDFPSPQSPVSDRTEAFGKNKGGSPTIYSDFQMTKVETQSPVSEERRRIGMLRQWLNEDRIDDPKKMVTNEDIEFWLSGNKE